MTNLYYALSGGVIIFIAWQIMVHIILPRRPKHVPFPTLDPLPTLNKGDAVQIIKAEWSFNLQDYRYKVGEIGKVVRVINPACVVVELENQREFIMPSFHVRRYYD
jgi:hypothetical protein